MRQLEKAEKYIFLEYFIIDEGLMWGKILEVLARKAAEGVDVRVMYDGTCGFATPARDYPNRLESWASSARCSRRCDPFSTHYNYRDHRKILVIDGKVGFTGGVNLADSTSSHREVWPLEGRRRHAGRRGCPTLTILFLEMWASSGSRSLKVPLRAAPLRSGEGVRGLRRLPAGR